MKETHRMPHTLSLKWSTTAPYPPVYTPQDIDIKFFKRNSMSRKHFKAIADAIRENIELKSKREEVAKALLSALKESNPRFDANRFMLAAVGE